MEDQRKQKTSLVNSDDDEEEHLVSEKVTSNEAVVQNQDDGVDNCIHRSESRAEREQSSTYTEQTSPEEENIYPQPGA